MRSEQEANRAVERYADMVRRLCLVHLKNEADTEDVFQTVFLKYVLYRGTFESEEHEKAWILRVTLNACRDVLRSLFRARRAPEEAALAEEAGLPLAKYGVYEEILALDPSFAAEEAASMTMRALRERLLSLTEGSGEDGGSDMEAEAPSGGGAGNGYGAGSGYGQGAGEGNGSGNGYGNGHGAGNGDGNGNGRGGSAKG